MIEEPKLPDYRSKDWPEKLTWTLTKILRQLATDVNKTTGSDWDGNHPVLGSYHLWLDTSGRLRVKSSKPTSATDGTIIGTQT